MFAKWFQLMEYKYIRMDGEVDMKRRSFLINKFNNDESIFIFLLTTKVGGEGISLTSANRVIIYDPDWNPSTDAQARERCWRMGQKRDVIIMRLFSLGTIEEKIFNRQTRKRVTSTRVLENPCFSRYFKIDTFRELFTFSDFSETTLYLAKNQYKANLFRYLSDKKDNHFNSYTIPKLPSAQKKSSETKKKEKSNPLDEIEWSNIRVQTANANMIQSTSKTGNIGLKIKQDLSNNKDGKFKLMKSQTISK